MAKKAQYKYDKEEPYPSLPPRGFSTPHQREFDKQYEYENPTQREVRRGRSTIEQDQEAQRYLSRRGIGPPEKKRDDYLERKGIGPSREFFVRPGKRAFEKLQRESDLDRIMERRDSYRLEKEYKSGRIPKTPEPKLRPEEMRRRRM